ncbi:hypothetical protein M422DRAFT_264941 [Sphaerobolus stellatus SS14]|uniref:Uncharacterized protein n=1 Tax=Sphaerobolus stellatus (strain SS14) TaxID=990650 RepID=A0A0C9V785_SPHS4|nr:hypothetical protein M422DRAFT_264941 [Sphaerobolus stellatus SS14]
MSEAIGFRLPEDDIDLWLALEAQAILEKLKGSNTYAKRNVSVTKVTQRQSAPSLHSLLVSHSILGVLW